MMEVRNKLANVFCDDPDDLSRIFFFLDEEDKAYKDNKQRPYAPHWLSLKASLGFDEVFRGYAMRLSNDTRIAERDQEYRKIINQIYEESITHSADKFALSPSQKFDRSLTFKFREVATSMVSSLASVWSNIPAETKATIMEYIAEAGTNGSVVISASDKLVTMASGTVVMVGLAAVYLSYTVIKNIRQWWKGEISGKRCAKNITDSIFTLGAGIGGSIGGALFGTLIVPGIGTLIGGIVGGVVSAAVIAHIVDFITQKFFGLPKDISLENAYRFLGVKMTASNAEVNTAFRKLCLKHHPDKGGRKEDFLSLQFHMSIIKEARGDF